MRESTIRLAMLITGGGSTMQAIGEACRDRNPLHGRIEPVVVISSRDDAKGIQKAQDLGIPVEVVSRKNFPKGPQGADKYERELLSRIQKYHPDVVAQNGWLPKTPENVVFRFTGKIYNQHPGPLDPENLDENGQPLHFGGKGMHGTAVHDAVLEFQHLSGRRFPTEATIHRVTLDYDAGVVVFRREVAVLDTDTPESLQARVLPVEYEAQIIFFRGLYEGNVQELRRPAPLILPGEEQFLFQAKQQAISQYPNG